MGVIERGATPAGGDATVTYWFDATGFECLAEDAVTGEIVEYLRGEPIRWTYVEPGALREGSPDSPLDPDNQDLIKTGTWDIWWTDPATGLIELADTKDKLLAALGYDPEDPSTRREVAGMTVLPSWVAAPPELKADVYRWLEETRPSPQGAPGG